MRFQSVFYRYPAGGSAPALPKNPRTGAAITALGSDSVPSAPPGAMQDNVVTILPTNPGGGVPVRNLAIGFVSTGDSTLTASVYFWDDLTQSWFLITPTDVTLTSGQITVVPIQPNISPAPPVAANLSTPNAGGISLAVVPASSSTAGLYTFALAPSLT